MIYLVGLMAIAVLLFILVSLRSNEEVETPSVESLADIPLLRSLAEKHEEIVSYNERILKTARSIFDGNKNLDGVFDKMKKRYEDDRLPMYESVHGTSFGSSLGGVYIYTMAISSGDRVRYELLRRGESFKKGISLDILFHKEEDMVYHIYYLIKDSNFSFINKICSTTKEFRKELLDNGYRKTTIEEVEEFFVNKTGKIFQEMEETFFVHRDRKRIYEFDFSTLKNFKYFKKSSYTCWSNSHNSWVDFYTVVGVVRINRRGTHSNFKISLYSKSLEKEIYREGLIRTRNVDTFQEIINILENEI